MTIKFGIIKTKKGDLGKIRVNIQIKKIGKNNKERVYQRFCPKIQIIKVSSEDLK